MFLNRKSLLSRIVLLLVFAVGMVATNPLALVRAEPFVYYAAPDGAANDSCGGAWSSPCDLQYLLGRLTSGGEVWVKEGIYRPGTDRTAIFVIPEGVAMYGGFAGMEVSREQRDPQSNLTVLSGDLSGNDNNNIAFDEPTRAENAFHVVGSNDIRSNSLLDGFTITGGNANLDPNTHTARGGGMWLGGSSMAITNVIFTGNTSVELGGGMYTENRSQPLLTNVSFVNNSSEGGGGMANVRSNPVLTNVVFDSNIATYSGGGVLNLMGSDATFTDVTFTGNSAFSFSGGMGNYESDPVIWNSTFIDNHALANDHPFHTFDRTPPFGGGMYNSQSSPVIVNSTFHGNTTGTAIHTIGGGGIGNDNSRPHLEHVTIADNTDGVMNVSSYPIIRNSIIWGNGQGDYGLWSITDDSASNSIVSDSVVQNGFPEGIRIITTDPLLGSLGTYGGLTETRSLLPGSSAIDRANGSYCPATDQRNIARPQGELCDIGAFEYAEGPIATVTPYPNGPTSTETAINTPTPTRTPTHTSTSAPTRTPTAYTTPSSSCSTTYHGSLTFDGNSMNMSITNQTGVPLVVQDVLVTWDHDHGHSLGSDKTLSLLEASLNGTSFWNGNELGPTLTINPSDLSIPSGESTIRFNFHQAYDRTDGSERIRIELGTNGCQNYPIDSESAPVTHTPTTGLTWFPSTSTPTRTLQPVFTLTRTPSGTPTATRTPTRTPTATRTPTGTATLTATPGRVGVGVWIGGGGRGTYPLSHGQSLRVSYAGLDKGPVKLMGSTLDPIIGSEAVTYPGLSFSEMMGLPASQVDNIYWLPWYNSKTLDTQLRIANVGRTTATVHVTIGGVEVTGSPFTVGVGASVRKTFANIDRGPVKIQSNVDIVAAQRVIYKVGGNPTSFAEMMALPASQVDRVYWLPRYNSKTMDTQLRVANVSTSPATVHVMIGGLEVTGSPFTIPAGGSVRKSFPNIDQGPVEIRSNQDIVATERVFYKVNGVDTSFSETMALPANQLDNVYWLSWYNHTGNMDSQLRFANVSTSLATVHVFIGGSEVAGSPFTLQPGESLRKNFANLNTGPVQIVSDQDIVVAERVLYKTASGTHTSFSEMMALPASQLSTTYWLPWYNNIDFKTELRFGVP